MALGFRREGAPFGRVPVLDERFRLGRDGRCELVLHDRRVSRSHARLRYVKGEALLSAEDGARIFVNGKRTPLMALASGDRVDLLPPEAAGPVRLVFENRLEGTFVSPGCSFVEAWLAHPAYASGSFGPEGYGVAAHAAAVSPLKGVDPISETPVVVRVGPAFRRTDDAERGLRVLARWAGGPHPALATVLDAGLLPSSQGPCPWTALAYVPGVSADEMLSAGPCPAGQVLRALVPVAYGLAWLHRRGIVHRDVAPGNLIVRGDGRGVLIDVDQARLLGVDATPARGVVGTPGYVAPEEVLDDSTAYGGAQDVYGLCAVGYALLAGRPPAEGDDLLSTVASAARPPPRLSDLGVSVPLPLEEALLSGLAAAPAARPDAWRLACALEALRSALALAPP